MNSTYIHCFFARWRALIHGLPTALLLLNGSAIAAPISFNSALPVSQGERIVRSLLTIERRSSATEGNDLQRDQLSLTSVFGYGVNAKWSVFGVLPVRHTELNINGQVQSNTDVGDTQIFSRFEAWKFDKPGTTLRIAPFAGIRLPTGKLGSSGDDTTDVFAGLVFTSANIEQNFDVQLRYDRNGSNNQINIGDSINLDLSWQKRIYPRKIDASTKGFWFAAIEANLNQTQRNRITGDDDPDSGGFVASLSPGIQYITRRWIAELAVRVPVFEDLNGTSLAPDYTLFTGLRANF